MKQTTILILLCLLAFEALAHDCFLISKPFRVKPGEQAKIAVHVDDYFPGKSVAWNPDRVQRLEHWYSGSKSVLLPRPFVQDSSGILIEMKEPGTHLVAVDWSARFIEIEPKKFAQYLKSEGLDHVLKLRAERNEQGKPGRERYSRYLKTLVAAGKGEEESVKSIVGQSMELVPLDNPYLKKRGESVRFRLLFRGEPLEDALVSATYAGATKKADTYAQSARTDRNGIVTFRLTNTGAWLVRTVHMLPTTGLREADWESWWASVTFDVR